MCILFFCSVDDFAVVVGRVFRLNWVGVAETGSNIRDVTIHGCSARSFVVVPHDVDAGISLPCPISCDGVVGT